LKHGRSLWRQFRGEALELRKSERDAHPQHDEKDLFDRIWDRRNADNQQKAEAKQRRHSGPAKYRKNSLIRHRFPLLAASGLLLK